MHASLPDSGRREVPIVAYLEFGDRPRLVANACLGCGALYLDRRVACAHCEGREFERRPLADSGTVRSFTIVHRGPSHVTTPYVSAIVELDGGGIIKANLLGIEPAPEQVLPGMRVVLTTFTAGVDDDGTVAVAFAFEPQSGSTEST